MAGKVKLTRKEVRAPDEFQNWMGKAYEWFKLYGAWVGLGAAVIVVGIIAGVLLSRHAETSKVETSAALDRALAPIAAAQATAPSKDDKDAEAAKKASEDARGRAKAAIADLDKFAAAHGDKPVARLAILGKAAAAMVGGDPTTAVAAYTAFLTAEPTATFAFVAWESKGNEADAAGHRDEAEAAYGEMAKSTSSLIRAVAALHLGDLYNPATRLKADEPSDKTKAKDFYDTGLKEFGGEEAMLPPVQLVTKKTLQERLVSLR